MKSIFLFLLSMALPVMAQEPDSSSALFQMREAERNFARASVMHGRNAAFVENFADQSVIFTDKWLTNGKQFWKERKILPVVLKWEPEFMDIADSRDFGISTGPWEAQEYRPNTAPLSTGYFLTVWKNNPLPATYTLFLAPNARMQLTGHLPTTNTDTIKVWIAQLGKTLIWRSSGSGVASSGDIGFTYGYLEIPGNAPGSKGHYVRIWRKQPAGKWNIILEMMSID